MSLQRHLNRLLGTTGVASQKAANLLAGTTDKEFLGALNVLAGTTGKGLVHVCNLISVNNGGQAGLDPLGAFAQLEIGDVSVGGFDSTSIAFSSAFTGEYTQFYDGEGASY